MQGFSGTKTWLFPHIRCEENLGLGKTSLERDFVPIDLFALRSCVVLRKPGFSCLLLLLAVSFSASAHAATACADDTTLGAIETKLFRHPYANESADARISRLEKFVFGAPNSDASTKDRLNRLSACLPSKTIATAPQAAPSAVPADISKYPRVTQLELILIGKSYFGEPIARRLSRLELTQFGAVSTSTDLAERADRLSTIAIPGWNTSRKIQLASYQPAAAPVRGMTGFIHAVSDAPKRVQITTVVDQIEYLENKTFGKIRPNIKLQKRVSALEKSYYGAAKSDDDTLTLRVAQLLSSISSGNFKSGMHS
jgi:hypothetical protein